MIIKKISINNIRSYENAQIEFPKGSTLLAGDIGSGKTSILLAIEFALFGLQPGQKGASLLRSNSDRGSVILELEIDTKNIVIERSLKRGKSVSQEEARITIDNETKEMSVSELKNLILSLLDYPPEFAKKSNMLYRFTVYTPQEEMKQIILENTETRLDTLRHVFGIDKYKRIKDNAEIFRIYLRDEAKHLQGAILDLDSKKLRKETRLMEIKSLKKSISEIETELLASSEKKKQVEDEISLVRSKIDEKKKLENEIEKTLVLMAGKREMLVSLLKEKERIESQTKELEKLSFVESELSSLEKDIPELKKQSEETNTKSIEVSTQISSLLIKNSENENLKLGIAKLEHCPTCLQNVDSGYKANIFNKFDSEISSNKKIIQSLGEERAKLSLSLESYRKKIQEKESRLSELRTTRIKLESLPEKKSRIVEIEKNYVSLEKDFEMLEKHVSGLKRVILDFSRFDSIFKSKEAELELARKSEKAIEIKLASYKKEIEFISKEILELGQEIEAKENHKLRMNYFLTLQEWLSSSFLELISFTETNVMLKLRDEFSKLFNEWFNILVPDIFTVRLDDSFTPIIEQQDYELDYSFLSGGERTAIALAYRLALNQTINSLLSRIKTREIVILDEPTDGFSEQQLDKMRDVLSQLKVTQLIIVSHESKIESFVENIIKFRKESGVTKIEAWDC